MTFKEIRRWTGSGVLLRRRQYNSGATKCWGRLDQPRNVICCVPCMMRNETYLTKILCMKSWSGSLRLLRKLLKLSSTVLPEVSPFVKTLNYGPSFFVIVLGC
jgi:hypothetical protein